MWIDRKRVSFVVFCFGLSFTNPNFYVKFRVFDKVISPPINMYFTHSACGTFIVNTSLTYNVLQNTFGAGLFRVTGVVL